MIAPEKRAVEKTSLEAVCEEILDRSRGRSLLFLGGGNFSLFSSRVVVKNAPPPIAAVRGNDPAGNLKKKGWSGPIIRSDLPDFVDRLKVISNEKGFETILVLEKDPAAVRQALGAAAVFGKVHLLMKPAGPVSADLHSTINFKSLQVSGVNI